jgi:hypothetical protein
MDRPNVKMATIVETGLTMASRLRAIAYMLDHRVPERVIARVLSPSAHEGERRAAR